MVVQDGDAVVIFNFRSDRVTELSKALEYDDFTAFDRWLLLCFELLPFHSSWGLQDRVQIVCI